MNRNQSDQYGMNEGYQTRRSERYRHPERDSNYRFDDYGSPARGGYGDESHSGTWGNQGNEMGGSRNLSGRDRSGTYSTSRNFGNMGSYGGSQGYGSSRGGYPTQREEGSGSLYHYESGMGTRSSSPAQGRRSYGYSSDYDSHGSGYHHDDTPEDLYGSDVSRRFQGTDQGRYDFDRNRTQGRKDMSDNSNYWDRDNYDSSGYGGSEGSYMGSGYNRTTRGSDMGDYGSMGSYSSDNYGMRGSSGSGYGQRQQHDPYARDRENARIHHPDSDYDYDPNHAFDSRKRPDFLSSHNRGRTWNRDRDFDRY
ncbi:hypothetical protein ABID22_003216 [Pontibacter aydingkolensis]|uniref:SWFGD domain-containing protein n=1 Tax=Pontibacter aydingkolensis TaxID=1911536 RepID=A0ABS7CS71_9BACT|nr:hypothetical protein [Pontibacter aydingkolensis]MBW7466702.1 hypothetical protein [Pontibacter aydingkolensis]